MTLHIESRHDLSPNEVDAIDDRLIDHNGHATGRHDSQGLGFVIRDEAGAGVPRDTQFFAAFRHLRVSLPDLQHAIRNRLAVVVEYPPLVCTEILNSGVLVMESAKARLLSLLLIH
jgi:hypothetical protein